MEGKCAICGVPRYGIAAVNMHGGKWRHGDTTGCLSAVGIELRALRTLIEALDGKVEANVDWERVGGE